MSLIGLGESGRSDGEGPIEKPRYDVFLSYRTVDGSVVREVARRLREAGVPAWFAEDSIPPGADWQDEIEARLMDCGSCAIFRGPSEITGWVSNELKVAIDRGTKDHDFQVFAVVLPGVDYFDSSMLPRFLAMKQWVDLRAGPESTDAIRMLVDAIYRLPPRHVAVDVEAGECPYRGLEVFEEEHTRFFFGREAEVQRLLENLRRDRFLAVVGQSGVGKSSLVRAGLLPELRKGALPGSELWRVMLMRPGAEPATALAARLLALQSGSGMQATVDRLLADERTLHQAATLGLVDEPTGTKLLVVVDQFEEVFTQCRNRAERAAFINNLHYAATADCGHVVVVLVLRADFYPRLTEFPEFAQLTQSRHLLIPRMSEHGLRAVIQEPAAAVGLIVEPHLADTILDDVERDPGNLPLLEHALLETWRHRQNGMLTLAGYRESGGVQRGLGERAEAVYDALSGLGKTEARKLFLRLVQPGEGTADTRRRVAVDEVMTGDDDPVADVVRRFASARLLTTSRDDATGERRIEISHEAVITGWERCNRWVDGDRAGLLIHRRLTHAAREWDRHDRTPDALYRGVPLAEAVAWRAGAPGRLNWLEQEFLDAGVRAERATELSRRRWVWTAFVALFAVAAVIAVIAVVAVRQADEAARQRDIATSRQLAAEASNALAVDPALGLTLALRAVDVSPTAQADEVLRQATAESRARSVIVGGGGPVYGVRFLPDGRRAVSGAADGLVRLWDLPDGTLLKSFAVHTRPVFAVRVSPDGGFVASASRDGTVALTALADGQSRVLLRASVGVSDVEFSHSGSLLAASLYDGTVHLIELPSGHERAVIPGDDLINSAAFSPDDALIAAAESNGKVLIWSLRDNTQREIAANNDRSVYDMAFSSLTGRLLTAGDDGSVRLWDPDTGEATGSFVVSDQAVYAVRFTPDGRRLAVAGADGAIYLRASDGLALASMRGHAGAVLDVDFDPMGDDVVSAGTDGTVRTWTPEPDVHLLEPMTSATFDRNATRIVAGAPNGRLRVWASNGFRPLLDLPDHTARSFAGFSTDATRIISYGEDGRVNVRAAGDGHELATFNPQMGPVWSVASDQADRRLVIGGDNGAVQIADYGGAVLETLSGAGSPVYSVTFGPDDQTVAAGRDDGTITLWGPQRVPLTITAGEGAVNSVAFSPDGSLIASAHDSGSIHLMDLRGHAIAVLRGHRGAAYAVRFRSDGQQLVSGGGDGVVRVWDTRTGGLLREFDPGGGPADSVDIGPDGTRILKSSEKDRTLRLLTCHVCGSLDSVVALARAHPPRPLTQDEERRFAS